MHIHRKLSIKCFLFSIFSPPQSHAKTVIHGYYTSNPSKTQPLILQFFRNKLLFPKCCLNIRDSFIKTRGNFYQKVYFQEVSPSPFKNLYQKRHCINIYFFVVSFRSSLFGGGLQVPRTASLMVIWSWQSVHRRWHKPGSPAPPCPNRRHSSRQDGKCPSSAHYACTPGSGAWSTV